MAVAAAGAQQQIKGGGFSGAPSGVGDGWYRQSTAFVVGIDSYTNGWGRLSAGILDAKKMAHALKERGFAVNELYDANATGPSIVENLRKTARKTGKDDRFIFYFSGHGYTEKSLFDGAETGYLVPVEGRSGDTSSYIPMEQIRTEIMNNCRAKHVLVILDTCFSGSLLTRMSIQSASVGDYLGKRGIYGITAGMRDQPAVDGLFTNVLIEGLGGNADYNGDRFVTFKELGMYAEANVKAKNRHQTPDYGTMYGAGQFVFAMSGAARELAAKTPGEPSVDYKAPTTDYAAIALAEENRLGAVEETKRKTRGDAARKAYSSLKTNVRDNRKLSATSKKKAYRRFLADYPEDNPHMREVNEWIEEPEQAEDMVYIKGGAFWMGCASKDKKCLADEKPRHEVTVDPFWLDVHEVTVEQYSLCVRAYACREPRTRRPANVNWDKDVEFAYNGLKPDRRDHPVNGVAWEDADGYCRWVGKRLPTEAEFEFALRGGKDDAVYPWGDSKTPPNEFANYADEKARERFPEWKDSWIFPDYDDGYAATAPVCGYARNEYGLCDISGNLWEWCADYYQEDCYALSPSDNPKGPSTGPCRVLRGGGWDSGPSGARASIRGGDGPGNWHVYRGFRCAKD